jgi:hypothetical protein
MDDIYKTLCDLSDLIIKHYNPCHREGNRCLTGTDAFCCHRTAFKRKDYDDDRCLHLDDFNNSCHNPNLKCKAWLCRTAMELESNKDCTEILKAVELIAKKFKFVEHPFLGERYVGIEKF